MIDQMELPQLKSFPSVLDLYNLRKLYQYLLFFAKKQSSLLQSTLNKHNSNLNLNYFPTHQDRQYLINFMLETLNQCDNVVHIIGIQKMISGMLMLGHVHIYEIMIREIFPTFLQIIDEGNGYRSNESQMMKHQESVLKVDGKQKKSKVEIMRKIKQFCKQSILILSIWFPKDFYDPSSMSWFRKVVQKYEIKCQFFVYYKPQTINKYEEMIKKLKLDIWQSECLECINCIDTKGQNYHYLKSMQTFSSLLMREQKMETESDQKDDVPSLKKLLKDKLKEKIKKKKHQLKESRSISQNQENSSLMCSNNIKIVSNFTPQKNFETDSYIKKSRSQVNLADLRNRLKQRKKTRQRTRERKKGILNSLQKKQISEGSLKIFSKKLLPKSSIFGVEYEKLGRLSKKFFRKECLKRKKKIMTYSEEGITVQIRSKMRGKFLELKLSGFLAQEQKVSIKLISPTNPQSFIKKRLNTYTFKLNDRNFEPIIVRVNQKQIILPVSALQLLDDVKQQVSDWKVEVKEEIGYDEQIFKSVHSIVSTLGLTSRQGYYSSLSLYEQSVFQILIFEIEGNIIKLVIRTNSQNQTFLNTLFNEIKQCICSNIS